MNRLGAQDRFLAAAAAALAGFVDAVGFIELGGFFVSFMSGNTTRFAVGLAASLPSAVLAGSLIAAFLIGVIAGSLTGHAAGRRRKSAVLVLVALALAVAASIRSGLWLGPILMAFAMGAENAIFEKDGDVRVGLTYMTGTLVKVGQRIAAALRGGEAFAWVPFLLQWLALSAGALVGALLHPFLGPAALWFAAAAAGLLAVVALSVPEAT